MTYTVVVRDPNSWSASTGIHLMLRDCGHKHRTLTGAQACMDKLVNACCQHGTRIGQRCSQCFYGRAKHASQWSANWHRAYIEDEYGRSADPGEERPQAPRRICNRAHRQGREHWRCVLFIGHAGDCSPLTQGAQQ